MTLFNYFHLNFSSHHRYEWWRLSLLLVQNSITPHLLQNLFRWSSDDVRLRSDYAVARSFERSFVGWLVCRLSAWWRELHGVTSYRDKCPRSSGRCDVSERVMNARFCRPVLTLNDHVTQLENAAFYRQAIVCNGVAMWDREWSCAHPRFIRDNILSEIRA